MHLKICGLRDPAQAGQVAQLGVDAIGVIGVESSPRFVPVGDRAAVWGAIADVSANIERVIVLANPDAHVIEGVRSDPGATVVQLHGDEPPERCRELRQALQRPIWKALRIRSPQDLALAEHYANAADALLLDAWVPDQLGGSGVRIPIEWLNAFQPSLPWWLAGGISAPRVEEIRRTLTPFGLDASSGVERAPADKDLSRVRELVDAVRR